MVNAKSSSSAGFLAAVLFAAGSSAQVTHGNSQPEARNLRLVAHHDLQGRSAYHPIPHRYGERMILFVGHHIGGGFGAKLDLGIEPYAALLARAAGRPVKLVNEA